MPILLKTEHDIALLREAGRIVAETYEVLRPHIVPGVSTADLDRIAEEYIQGKGARPMYKHYGAMYDRRGRQIRPPFPATICASVNDVICHGIPSKDEVLQEGDIIGVDIGSLYRGWIGDSCVTYTVGTVAPETQRLVDVARRSMEIGIEQARPGNHIGDIGAAIQAYAEGEGFGVVRELGGHGVGRALWEEPFVPHVGKPGTGPLIRPGMVFTIEPMLTAGDYRTTTDADGWAIRTADHSLSAQFEHTMVITDDGPELLTVL